MIETSHNRLRRRCLLTLHRRSRRRSRRRYPMRTTLVEAATKEGTVSVYTSTDTAQSQGLLDAFTAKYRASKSTTMTWARTAPTIGSSPRRPRSQVGGDVVWSSAMDLQMTLAADGYFEPYASPEAAAVPDWGKYQDMLYATTVEPIGMIYNKIALSEDKFPKTRADLIKFLRTTRPTLQGKVATFDPEKSGTGFLSPHQRCARDQRLLGSREGVRRGAGKTYSSTRLDEGDGGVRRERARLQHHRFLRAGVGQGEPEPRRRLRHGLHRRLLAARWRSRRARRIRTPPSSSSTSCCRRKARALSPRAELPSVRDGHRDRSQSQDAERAVGGNLKPIALDDTLLEYMEPMKRVEFLNDWKAAANELTSRAPAAGSRGRLRARRLYRGRRDHGRPLHTSAHGAATAIASAELTRRPERLPRPGDALAFRRHRHRPPGDRRSSRPSALIVYQSFLDNPFFAPNVKLSLDAYRYVLTDSMFYEALWNTVIIAVGMVAIAVPLGAAARLPAHPHRREVPQGARGPRPRADVHLVDRARLRLHRVGRAVGVHHDRSCAASSASCRGTSIRCRASSSSAGSATFRTSISTSRRRCAICRPTSRRPPAPAARRSGRSRST